MAHICRLVCRTTYNLNHVSRMNAHNYAPGTKIKSSNSESESYVVSGSGQFLATDNFSTADRLINNTNVLPGGQSVHDKTNLTKTASNFKEIQGNINEQNEEEETVLNGPAIQIGTLVIALASIYATYKMLSEKASNQREARRILQATNPLTDEASENTASFEDEQST